MEDITDTLTLVCGFLEATGCSSAAEALRSEVAAKGLAPKRVAWDGSSRRGQLPPRAATRTLPRNALVRALTLESSAASGPSTSSPTPPTTTPDSLLARTRARLQTDAERLLADGTLTKLVDARAEQRRLETESGRRTEAMRLVLARRVAVLRVAAGPLVAMRRRRLTSVLDVLDETLREGIPPPLVRSPQPTPAFAHVEHLAIAHLSILKRLVAHHGPVYSAAVANGFISTGADDFLVKTWNARTGALESAFRAHEEVLTDVVCFPLAALVAAKSLDPALAPFASDVLPFLAASASDDSSVRVFHKKSCRPLAVLRGHRKPVQRIEFALRGTKLVSVGDDGAMCVWDVVAILENMRAADELARVRAEQDRERRRHDAAQRVLDEGGDAAAAAAAGAAALAEPTTATDPHQTQLPLGALPLPLVFPHCSVSGQPLQVVSLAVHPTLPYAASGAEDGVARVWSLTSSSSELASAVSSAEATAMDVEENAAAAGDSPRRHATNVTRHAPAVSTPGLLSIEYVDGADHLVSTLAGHSSGIVAQIEWAKTGDRLLTFSDKDGTARVWSFPNSTPEAPFSSRPQHVVLKALDSAVKGRPSKIDAAAFCGPHAKLVVTTQSTRPPSFEDPSTAFWDSRVCVWDAATGALLRAMRAHRNQAYVIRPHPRLPMVFATCGADGLMVFWDAQAGKELKRLEAISHMGYASVFDARWVVPAAADDHAPDATANVDFVATDSMGRLLLIGTGSAEPFRLTPSEQFFENENAQLTKDFRGNAIDLATQLPPHLLPRARLVDSFGEPYDLPSSATAAGRKQLANIVRARDAVSASKEAEAEEASRRIIKRLDEDIARARRADAGVAGGGAGKPSGAGGATSSGGVRLNGNAVPARGRRPGGHSARAAGMLLLELPQDDASVEAVSVGGDDVDDGEAGNGPREDGRARRAAARRANAQIHRQVRHLDAPLNSTTPAASTSGRHGARGAEEEEEDAADDLGSASESDDSDDDDDDDSDSRGSGSEEDGDDESFDSDGQLRPRRRHHGGGGSQRRRRRHRHRRRHSSSAGGGGQTMQTRGVRQRYDGYGTDDSDEERRVDLANDRAAAAAATSTSRAPRGATTAAATTPNNNNINVANVLLDTRWLLQTDENPLSCVPQKGDHVVYFPQGHADFLREFPSIGAPPWQSWNVAEWPYVLCELDEVAYAFPAPSVVAECVANGVAPKVPVLCYFSVIGAPKLDGSGAFDPLPAEARETNSFVATFQASDVPDFLVLEEKFRAGVAQRLRPGDAVRVPFLDEDGAVEYLSLIHI